MTAVSQEEEGLHPTAWITLILLLLFVVGLAAQGQEDLFTPAKLKAFGDHLFNERDYLRAATEYERYLFLSAGGDDSTRFKVGLCHQLRGRHDLAVEAFKDLIDGPDPFLKVTAREALLYNLVRLEDWPAIEGLPYLDSSTVVYYYLARVSLDPSPLENTFFQVVPDDSLRDFLLDLEVERMRAKGKSPYLAGLLSALLPGAGKLYIHRAWDGVYTLAATLVSGYVALHAFRKGRTVTGFFTSGLSLSFYLGSVYGSYVGARLYNQHRYDRWRRQLESLNTALSKSYWEQWLAD